MSVMRRTTTATTTARTATMTLVQEAPTTASPTPRELSTLCDDLNAALSTKVTTSTVVLPVGSTAATRANLPHQPDWLNKRPNLCGDVVSTTTEDTTAVATNDERTLLEDMLYALVGAEGRLVRLDAASGRFCVSSSVTDTALRGVAERILARAADPHAAVRAFVAAGLRYARGCVCHALCAGMGELVREWLVVVAQLEHQHRLGRLTLHKAVFYTEQPARTLHALAIAAVAAGSLRGGALLDALHKAADAHRGDDAVHTVLSWLCSRAAVPFMDTLNAWLLHGDLSGDVDCEFMVEERVGLRADALSTDFLSDFWDRRFALRPAMTPGFLAPHAQTILRAGKYCSVLRECNGDVTTSASSTAGLPNAVEYTRDERELAKRVAAADTTASAALLKLLMGSLRLGARLQSLKHYFLLDQGDFLMHFLDVAGDELRKPVREATRPRLNALLDVALRTSPLASDPFRSAISCDLLPQSFMSQLLAITHAEADQPVKATATTTAAATDTTMSTTTTASITALDAFAFDLQVEFPLSLVVSRAAVVKYQLLLRFLLLLKHVEARLGAAWAIHMGARRLGGVLQPLHLLRHRMLLFVRSYLGFVTTSVLEPAWRSFADDSLPHAGNLDDVIRLHTDFLDSCLVKSTLTDPALARAVTRITAACTAFAAFAESADAALGRVLEDAIHTGGGPSAMVDAAKTFMTSQSVTQQLARLDRAFSSAFRQFIDTLRSYTATDYARVAPLLAALDYSSFYDKNPPQPVSPRQ